MTSFIAVSLVKSMIGRPKKHRKILQCMKLTKLNRTIKFKNSSMIRGMINKVSHLVSVSEVKGK